VVPSKTIVQAEGDSTWVWRYERDRVYRAMVQLGGARRDGIRIEAGLSQACSVVVGTDRALADGALVEVVESR
jgi:hypothetical protein